MAQLTDRAHGGGCCGIRHLYDLDEDVGVDDLRAQMPVRASWTDPDNASGVAREMVFTDDQLEDYPDVAEFLDQHPNITEIAQWENSNTDNVCHMFFYGPNRLREPIAGPPAPVVVEQAPPAPPEPRYRWRLNRIRFDELGLISSRIPVHSWPEEPSEEELQHALAVFTEGRRAVRWRYILEREQINA